MWSEPTLFQNQPDNTGILPIENTDILQGTIAEEIEEILWMKIWNQLLAQFINDFVHPRQIIYAKTNPPSERFKDIHKEEIASWEKRFTGSVYRAAVIAAKIKQEANPRIQWINISTILEEAEAIIRRDTSDNSSPFEDIGYQA